MAKKETLSEPKNIIESTPEQMALLEKDAVVAEELAILEKDKPVIKEGREKVNPAEHWIPRTELGKAVKAGKIKNIDEVLDHGKKILESGIVDSLLNLDSDLLLIGQAKGKFGGGKRRAWRQTQRKTMEGNVLTFSSMAVVGDRNGHVGVGLGKAKETLPARDKGIRNAKLNIMKVKLGWETHEAGNSDPHTVPFKVEGKCGSVRITFLPAPRGTGLVAGEECKKILRLAGVKDVYSKTFGQTRTTFNLAKACIDALQKTNKELLK